MHSPAAIAQGLDRRTNDPCDQLSDEQLRRRIEADADELKRRRADPGADEADRLPSRPLG